MAKFQDYRPYCSVYCPDSMLACSSEFRFNRLKIIFACDLTSASSVSTWEEPLGGYT